MSLQLMVNKQNKWKQIPEQAKNFFLDFFRKLLTTMNDFNIILQDE